MNRSDAGQRSRYDRPRIQSIRTVLIAGTLGLALAVGLASSATAHGRSVSYSSWEIDSPSHSAVVSVRVRLLELSRLGPNALPPEDQTVVDTPGSTDQPARRFPNDLVLVADGVPCAPTSAAERKPDEEGWVRYQWRLECPPEATELSIRSRILLDVAPSHMHFARVVFSDDRDAVREQVLTEARPEFKLRIPDDRSGELESADSIGHRLLDYIELGVEHILTGWDHLAFVFGLLLLARRFGEVARLITGFTLAHSLTLALTVQGLVHPRAAAVEVVIAFSVALVAIEKSWQIGDRNRAIPLGVVAAVAALGLLSILGWTSLPLLTIVGLLIFSTCYFGLARRSDGEWFRICLTFAFGLVHGFGFAGVLLEMALPTDRLAPALLGFNLGVELGQIGVVLVLWPLLALGARLAPANATRLASEISAAALCGLGVYWLIERAFPL